MTINFFALTDDEIKEILRSSERLSKIISSDDRHDMSNFLQRADDSLKRGILTDEDMRVIRGYLPSDIITGMRRDNSINGRPLLSYERADKMTYMSLFPDFETQSAFYCNPTLVREMAEGTQETEYFLRGACHNLPFEIRTHIATGLISCGSPDKANEILIHMKRDMSLLREQEQKQEQKGRQVY